MAELSDSTNMSGQASGSAVSPGGPLVSVVVPTHNRAPLLRRAIDSVLEQTYRNLDLIVVDDASEDDTAEVVASFDDRRVRYYRHETNRHVSATRNTGIEHSRGEYVAFLDDDDEWLPTKLEKQVRLMNAAPDDVGLVYCWMDYFDGQGRKVSEVHPTLRGNVFDQVLDRQRLGNSSTLLVRTSVVKEMCGFDELLRRGNDGDFIRRVCLRYAVDLVPEVLVRVNVGHGPRISMFDEEGIRNAIKGHAAKLTKFRDELPGYPRQAAAIHASLAQHYIQLGQWRNGWAAYVRALKTSPSSPDTYVSVLRSLKDRVTKPRRT